MTTLTDQFKAIVKRKGTGKTMSKHLSASDIAFVMRHLNNSTVPLATRATILTAWIMLDRTDDEHHYLSAIMERPAECLPQDLHYLIHPTSDPSDQLLAQLMRFESLSDAQIPQLYAILDDHDVPSHRLAVLFESLRLKEETLLENMAIHSYFSNHTHRMRVNVPLLVDMATPYDGFNRTAFLQPFLCALLASVGIPTVIHGLREVSPKQGMTTHKLFLAAGKNPYKPLATVTADIEHPMIGWGYVDQSVACPALHRLVPLRVDMVKRPALATIEKWLMPIQSPRTICMTGYTHPPFKQKTLAILNQFNAFDAVILTRGIEGSTLLPMDRRAPWILSTKTHPPRHNFMSPTQLELPLTDIESTPSDSIPLGLAALSGKHPIVQSWLTYQALAIASAIGHPLTRSDVDRAIHTGDALARWNAM